VRYWTVLDVDLAVVAEAATHSRRVRFGRDGSELTTTSYAGAGEGDPDPTGPRSKATSIARHSGVDRIFVHRHRDLFERIHAAATQPPDNPVTRASLRGDLLAARQGCTRMAERTRQLETRLSELFGEQLWRATGLGAPTDIDQLQQRIVTLEQPSSYDCKLDERDQDLVAARAVNRELMARLNVSQPIGYRASASTTPVAHHILQQPAMRTAETQERCSGSSHDPKRTACTAC
jgi:hypothetical protein